MLCSRSSIIHKKKTITTSRIAITHSTVPPPRKVRRGKTYDFSAAHATSRAAFRWCQPMTDSERLARIERKVDDLGLRLDDFRVLVEGRLTRLEVKAAIWGAAAGAIVGAIMARLA